MLKLESLVHAALEGASEASHSDRCETRRPYTTPAPCNCHVGHARLALSLYTEHGHLHAPTADEIRAQLGPNWVIARRTPRIVRQYGEDVICVSSGQYDEGERLALRDRCVRMGVEPFDFLTKPAVKSKKAA